MHFFKFSKSLEKSCGVTSINLWYGHIYDKMVDDYDDDIIIKMSRPAFPKENVKKSAASYQSAMF